jgi:hypothetical protein
MEIEYDDTCVCCKKEKKNVLMVPCRHNVVCQVCAEEMVECPLCKRAIEEKIKIYI